MWKTVKLGEICKFEGGSQPPKKEFVYEPADGYVRFLQIRDFKSDKNITYIPTAKKNRLCSETDILIGRYGASVGQILSGLSGAYNVALMKTIPNEELISKGWLQAYLTSPLFQKPLMEVSSRSAQNGFSKDDIYDFDVPLPPLAEQQRIVAKLDAAFAEIDTVKNNTLAVSQTVSNMLPKLFSNLIDEVGAERTSTLGETCEFTQGIQIPKPEQRSVQSNDFPTRFLRIVDYTSSGKEEPRFIKEQNHRYLMKFDDVALVRYGNPGFVCRGVVGALANNLFKVIPRSYEISQDFLYYYLKSDVFQSVIRRKAHGVAMQAISFSLIKEIPFPILSTTSQAEFVKKAAQLEQHIDKIQNIYDSKVHTIEKLKSSIIAQELQSEAA